MKQKLRKIIREEIQKLDLNEGKMIKSNASPIRPGDSFRVNHPQTGIWLVKVNDIYYFLDDIMIDISGKHEDTGKTFKSSSQSVSRFKKMFVDNMIER